MIPGKIFTGFAKFLGIVRVNDFRILIGLQELLQASLGFLRSFCFARIRLDPLGENFVVGCNQITKILCTKYDSDNASSARGPENFGPFTDLAISVFWEVSINTVFTQIHTSHRL